MGPELRVQAGPVAALPDARRIGDPVTDARAEGPTAMDRPPSGPFR